MCVFAKKKLRKNARIYSRQIIELRNTQKLPILENHLFLLLTLPRPHWAHTIKKKRRRTFRWKNSMVIFYHQCYFEGFIIKFRKIKLNLRELLIFWKKVDVIIISRIILANPILFVIEKIAFAKSLFLYNEKEHRVVLFLFSFSLFFLKKNLRIIGEMK